MHNKCRINKTPYILNSDKYSVKVNKFEAENSDVLSFSSLSCYVISIEKKRLKEVYVVNK